MKHNESEIQQQVIAWSQICKYKENLKYLHHSPNGGNRSAREGARFKREGVKSGFPDLILPKPKQNYHGLFIEIKTEKGRITPTQKEWIEYLKENDYFTVVCRSFEETVDVIESYLSLNGY